MMKPDEGRRPGYRREWLRLDAVAGLTTAAVVIPKAMAIPDLALVRALWPGAIPGLLILRTEGRMTFASAPHLSERLWVLIGAARPGVVILECSAIPDFEYTALKALVGVEEKLRGMGIILWLAAINPTALQVIERSPLGQILGHERMFFNLRDAVRSFERRGEGSAT
jgi:MFS superfamily sulfate permease-like transporter